MGEHLLSLLIFLPVAVALLQLAVPARQESFFRMAMPATAVIQLVIFIYMLTTGTAPEVNREWFSISNGKSVYFSAHYHIGVDGLSLPMLGMSLVVLLVASMASFKIDRQIKGYSLLFQMLNTAVIGTFCALDMFLFYVFFEFMLVPMYFLVGIWGGARRTYAAIKFFLYTLAGSILILIAMVVLAAAAGSLDFDALRNLQAIGSMLDANTGAYFSGMPLRTWVFLLLVIGFAVKIPVVPLHTWLPDAHVEAPTAISVVLAGILLKTGGYGMIRFGAMIFPAEWQAHSLIIGIFAVVSVIYGGLNALAARDLKRMVAYASVSHMGFVLLGFAASNQTAMQGAVYQMASHGLVSAMLFLIAGVLQDRAGNRDIDNFSGLHQPMPVYSAFILLAFFAAMGIPGFSAFIGEVLVLLGSFASPNMPHTLPVLATLGILLSAGYLLWTITQILFGPFHHKVEGSFHDLKPLELAMLVPLAILVILFGIWPAPLLDLIAPFALDWNQLFPAG